MKKTYRKMTRDDRLKIEALHSAGMKPEDIAKQLGFHRSSIYRELHRGKTIHRNSDWTENTIYAPELAQMKADENKRNQGRPLKICNDMEFVRYIEKMVGEERYSPAAALAEIERRGLQFKTKICLSTLYNYIKSGVFLNITMEDTPYKTRKGKTKRHVKCAKKLSPGTSIDERDKAIESRDEAGHWEMDTVVGAQGKGKACLLVLTERKTRDELVFKMKNHTSAEVVRILDRIERKIGEKNFRTVFKTITVDNGTEFSDWQGIEKSRRNKKKKRTTVYYCHAYRSCERASNENNNKLIRRWYPKGTVFDDIPERNIKKVQKWMNDYPRKIFEFKTANELAENENALRVLFA